ncbi:conserved hypothetical protein [Burkholderia vietnamiensis]|nr:conserved hypothetical protein [Burkholderia vietnamiensis]
MFGRLGGPIHRARASASAWAQSWGNLFWCQARDYLAWGRSGWRLTDPGRPGLAALGVISTIARGAHAAAPRGWQRAASASTGRSEGASASSDP